MNPFCPENLGLAESVDICMVEILVVGNGTADVPRPDQRSIKRTISRTSIHIRYRWSGDLQEVTNGILEKIHYHWTTMRTIYSPSTTPLCIPKWKLQIGLSSKVNTEDIRDKMVQIIDSSTMQFLHSKSHIKGNYRA